jgi:hypothetical protein
MEQQQEQQQQQQPPPAKRRHQQQQQQQQERPEPTATARVFQDPNLLLSVLAFLPAPAFAAVPAVSRAFDAATAFDLVWRPLALCRWPSCRPILDLLQARGQPLPHFCRRRMAAERRTTDEDKEQKMKEEELARLRVFFQDSFLEVQLTHKTEGRVLASKLIPLTEEHDEELLTLFVEMRDLPLTTHAPLAKVPFSEYKMALTLVRAGDGQGEQPLQVTRLATDVTGFYLIAMMRTRTSSRSTSTHDHSLYRHHFMPQPDDDNEHCPRVLSSLPG